MPDADELLLRWKHIRQARAEVQKELEALRASSVIVANLADVTRAEPPPLASNCGGSRLAAGKLGSGENGNFGIEFRVMRKTNDGVKRVDAQSYEIGFRRYDS